MGEMKYQKVTKNCATCDYWQGPRKLDGWGVFAASKCEASAQGICPKHNRMYYMACQPGCEYYRSWGQLE